MLCCMMGLAVMFHVLDMHPHGVNSDSLVANADSSMVIDSTAIKEVQEDLRYDTINTHVYLSAFYKALKGADTTAIRIVHYGDSQIEEDRLTMQVRRAAHKRYGGGGVGIVPLHQTIPTRTIHQVLSMQGEAQSINQGPKRYMIYGPPSMHREDSCYGVMGQVAIMDNQLVAGSEDLTLLVEGTKMTHGSESYFNRIRILSHGGVHVTVDSALSLAENPIRMPDRTTCATIHLHGKGEVYGISLESERGVMVDNIPMRGCSGVVFSYMQAKELKDYFTATNTRLIILQYGGNTIPYTKTKQQVEQYVASMRAQVRYIKKLAPNSSILFVGPSDMSAKINDEMHTNPMVPIMDKGLNKMAVQEHIGYFSLYKEMGGYDSMIRWQEQGLAGSDFVHFTRQGADKAGKMLAEWIF